MYLLAGISVLSLTVLVWSIALILCRNPHPSWYSEEYMQAYVWTPLCASGVFFGVLLVRKSLPDFPPSVLEAALVAIAIFITVIIYKMLKVKDHLAAYENAEAGSKIFPFDPKGDRTTPPSGPKNEEDINLRDAA